MMMIAVCVGLLIGALGSAARYAQGNGHAGPGRWALVVICLAASWWALDPTTWIEWGAAVWLGALSAGTIALGYTRWEDIPYSFARYGIPPLVGLIPAMVLSTASSYALVYPVVVGVGVALGQFYLAQHKPQWLIEMVGNRDVATIPAGFLVAGGFILI